MKVYCDLSLPALFVDIVEGARIHTTLQEECVLLVDPNGELIGLKIALSETLRVFPLTPLDRIVQYCLGEAWAVERAPPLLHLQFRPGRPGGRTLSWEVHLAADSEGAIVGLDLDLSGNTDGEIGLKWLCEQPTRGPPGS
jgi:hypothetical protein